MLPISHMIAGLGLTHFQTGRARADIKAQFRLGPGLDLYFRSRTGPGIPETGPTQPMNNPISIIFNVLEN